MHPEFLRRDALPLSTTKEFLTCRQPAPKRVSERADIAARTQRFNEACTRIHATSTGASRKATTDEKRYHSAAAKRRVAGSHPRVARNR